MPIAFAQSPAPTPVTGITPQQNNELVNQYNRSNRRWARDTSSDIPRNIQNAWTTLEQHNVPVFRETSAEASYPNLAEVVVQEYLRSKPWGMPWLPLSWDHGSRDAEYSTQTIARNLEQNIAAKPHPISEDNLFILYLATGVLYHTSYDQMNEARRLAEELAVDDHAGFYQIRVEIHQEPGLRTLELIRNYIGTQSGNHRRRDQAQHLLQLMEGLFSPTNLAALQQKYTGLPQAFAAALTHAYTAIAELRTASSPAMTSGLIDRGLNALTELADNALSISQRIQNDSFTQCNPNSGDLDCAYKHFDVLRAFQITASNLSTLLQEKVVEQAAPLAPNDMLAWILDLTKLAKSVGLLNAHSYQTLTQFPSVQGRENALPAQLVLNYLKAVENETQVVSQRVRGIFLNQMETFGGTIPRVTEFVDETLRTSILGTFYNLTQRMQTALLERIDSKLRLGQEEIRTLIRVMNPGVAEGTLVFPTEEALANPSFQWNENGIYILPHTPADIGRVQGIITCDPGSMLSHVQLLAASRGIPNLAVSCPTLERLRPLEGQPVFMAVLPDSDGSSEAILKRQSEMTPQEIEIYQRYNDAAHRERITLPLPAPIQTASTSVAPNRSEWRDRPIGFAPIYLQQLRMPDRGVIAGGKACGQGEMASFLGHHVAPAIVLPFGVFFDHIRRDSQITQLLDAFDRPPTAPDTLNGTSPEIRARRNQILTAIRGRIQRLTLDPLIVQAIQGYLATPAFRGHGYFVRSDTNAEDLPQFNGAGLNHTEPNVMNLDGIIDNIKRVWASPFEERPFNWRSDFITNPWQVFPSVIIQVAIPSQKSGVMIVGSPTEDDLDNEVFIAANEGVGGSTVGGASAEEIRFFRQRNSRSAEPIQRVIPSYATARLVLLPTGGTQTVPTQGIRPLLSDDEIRRLATLGDQVQRHMADAYHERTRWDIEWGIVNGYVMLLQMRPFIGNRNRVIRDQSSLRALRSSPQPQTSTNPSRTTALLPAQRSIILPRHL